MKLGLGTAQFGFDYGISNSIGRVPLKEIEKIIEIAKQNQVKVIDTAPGYGISEEILGGILGQNHSFEIITKTRGFKNQFITKDDAKNLVDDFYLSLKRLKQDSIYGILIHDSNDLFLNNSALLIDALLDLKKRGLVQKVGVSVYTDDQIDQVFCIFEPELVQLPLNILDQRLIANGQLKKLRQRNVEIHARSTFLQGLLLMNPIELSDFFNPVREILYKFRLYLSRYGMSPLEGALSFVRKQNEVDCVLAGVCSAEQMLEILKAMKRKLNDPMDLHQFACLNENMVNPSKWPANSALNERVAQIR